MNNATTNKELFQEPQASFQDIQTSCQETLSAISSGFNPVETLHSNESRKKHERVTRKFEGFLVSLEGKDAVVCFIQNEECIEMVVPANNLIRNNIKAVNQPFEYIESDVFENGLWRQNIIYKPLCKPDEYTVTSVKLPDKTRKLLDALLKTE